MAVSSEHSAESEHSSEDSSESSSEYCVGRILTLFRNRGDAAYIGEPVSQTEHALQAASWAERESASQELVTAALLHDVGHLLHGLADDCVQHGIDDQHEQLGWRWLQQYFGPAVTEPVRMHVAAKRYLCATDPEYWESLSPASRSSLNLQGGPFDAAEVTRFQTSPFTDDAVRLRRWDDRSKLPGLVTPGLEHYRKQLLAALRADPGPD